MEMNLQMPVSYSVMNEEEMTYTYGGDAYDDSYNSAYALGSFIGSTISIGNYIWGVAKTREWITKNKQGRTFGQLLSKGMDDVTSYMSQSLWTAIVGGYTILNVTGWSLVLWPVTAIAWVTA